MYRVERTIDFCYGHRLLDDPGKCAHLHGHNGRAEIVLAEPDLNERGMVYDFGEVDRLMWGWIDEHIDHRMLLHRDDPMVPVLQERGEKVYVMDYNPTAENIARLLFRHARELGLPVVEVRMWEMPDSVAVYAEP
jgi:6-pyruvoyltetrahydropterin/6-carboxytetrahydropterin synthase